MAKNKENQTYLGLKQELDEVLDSLQREDIDIDEAMKAYERGMELVTLLEAQLKLAENKIVKLKTKFD